MDDVSVKATLARAVVFQSLDPDALQRLANECHTRRYGKGQLILLRGEAGDAVFVVASGSVALSIGSPDGGQVLLSILRPPQSFGELSVVDGGPRVATATARVPSTLVHVPGQVMRDTISRHPKVASAVITSLATLVRRMDERASDFVLLALPARVEKLLATLASEVVGAGAGDSGQPIRVELAITQTELARQVGGSRQQVNRILVDLEARGAIQRLGHGIVTIKPDLLSRA